GELADGHDGYRVPGGPRGGVSLLRRRRDSAFGGVFGLARGSPGTRTHPVHVRWTACTAQGRWRHRQGAPRGDREDRFRGNGLGCGGQADDPPPDRGARPETAARLSTGAREQRTFARCGPDSIAPWQRGSSRLGAPHLSLWRPGGEGGAGWG